MHASLHDATGVYHWGLTLTNDGDGRHEPMHAILHDATSIHGSLAVASNDDATAAMGYVANDAGNDATDVPLWRHVPDDATATENDGNAIAIHVQHGIHADGANMFPAAPS
ncbi:hypothetical protein ACP70R_020680 [Stipagrostis hirtigluma subsp. patula]